MDGKVVGRAIRENVHPLLKEAGFTAFTGRRAWRETPHTIDHVTLRSYNAYNAGVFGCTTYSFTVEVGVFYRCFAPALDRPRDYDCTSAHSCRSRLSTGALLIVGPGSSELTSDSHRVRARRESDVPGGPAATVDPRGSGGIGRRARLRIWCLRT